MAKVLDSLTLPIKKNGVVSNETIVNNPKSTAGQFSASTAYAVGQYVYYDKKLYRFTSAHAAGAWNASHVTEVTVASELADLKEDTNELKQDLSDTKVAFNITSENDGTIPAYLFEAGYYTNANVGSVPTWNRITGAVVARLSTPPEHPFIPTETSKIIIPTGYRAVFFKLDNADQFIELIGWVTGETVLESGYHYYITYAKTDDANIDIDDLHGFNIIPANAWLDNIHLAGDNFNLLGASRWVQGNILNSESNTPYIDYTNKNRIAIYDYLEPSINIKLSVDDGYKYYLFGIAQDGTTASVSGWLIGETTLLKGSRYMVIVAKSNDSTITTNEYKHLHASAITETTYKAETENVILSAIADRDDKTFTFALITDTHNDTNSARQTEKQGAKIGELADSIGALFTIHLGDVIQGTNATLAINKETLAEFWGEMHKQFTPILYTIAHHEMYGAEGASGWGQDPTACTASDCMGMYANNTAKWLNVQYSTDGLSWFCDIDNVRCIGLDSASNGPYGYSTDVINFAQNALDTDKKIILFAHVAPYGGVMTNGDAPTNGDALVNILNAHASNIIAFFHGHTHWDNYYKPNGGIMYISTCCALPDKVSETLYCPDGNPTAYERTLGTISEYCMDIVNVHLDSGIINTFRFGVGTDRTIT